MKLLLSWLIFTCTKAPVCFLSLQTDSLKCVAQASKNRSLADFEKVCVCDLTVNIYDYSPGFVFFPYVRKSSFGLLSLKCSALILSKALTEYKSELRDDPIISTHLTKLYDNLLEQNLIRVIEPFSRVQVIAQMLYIHRKRTLQFLRGQSL